MSNFPTKLEDATDEQLKHWINELDFRVVPLASDELTRRTLKKLQETIQVFNEQSSKQTQKMIGLTRWIVTLTIAMIVGLIIQIILAL
jgi:predicted DNA repair protein MutK